MSESANRTWPVLRLGGCGQIASGITLGRSLNGAPTRAVPYLRVANVKDGYLDLSDVYEVQATEAEIGKLRLQPGDLLLTEGGDRDKLGRGTYWRGEIPECIHQNHIFRVRLDRERVSPEFAAFQLGSPYGKAYFLAHAKQTTGIATINQKVLANFPLMAPPLSEQRRITALLTEQLAAVERARAAAEAQLAAANRLCSSYLRQAFSATDAATWPEKPLAHLLAAPLRMGLSEYRGSHDPKPLLTLSAVRDGRLDLSKTKLVGASEQRAAGNSVKPGAWYVVRGNGNLTLVGRGAFAPDALENPVLFPDLLIEVRVDGSAILPEFLRWAWDSERVRLDIENRARTAAGIYKINQQNLAQVMLPVPPLADQRTVAEALNQRMERVVRLQESLEQQLAAVNQLPAALLRRVFSGEA